MILILGTLAKLFALIGLSGAILFATSDSVVAAAIAAIGTVTAACVGVVNTFLLSKVYKIAEDNREHVQEVKGVVNRRYMTIDPPPDDTYKRKKDKDNDS